MNIYDEALELVITKVRARESGSIEKEKIIKALERAKKEHELVELYHDLLKLIGIYNSSTYCTKETRKDLKEKIKKIQTQIDELEKELEEMK